MNNLDVAVTVRGMQLPGRSVGAPRSQFVVSTSGPPHPNQPAARPRPGRRPRLLRGLGPDHTGFTGRAGGLAGSRRGRHRPRPGPQRLAGGRGRARLGWRPAGLFGLPARLLGRRGQGVGRARGGPPAGRHASPGDLPGGRVLAAGRRGEARAVECIEAGWGWGWRREGEEAATTQKERLSRVCVFRIGRVTRQSPFAAPPTAATPAAAAAREGSPAPTPAAAATTCTVAAAATTTPATPPPARRRPPPLSSRRPGGRCVGVGRGGWRPGTLTARRRRPSTPTPRPLILTVQVDRRDQDGRCQAGHRRRVGCSTTTAFTHDARPRVHALGDGRRPGSGRSPSTPLLGRGRVKAGEAQLHPHARPLGCPLLHAGQAGPLRGGRGGGHPAGDLALAEAGDVLAGVGGGGGRGMKKKKKMARLRGPPPQAGGLFVPGDRAPCDTRTRRRQQCTPRPSHSPARVRVEHDLRAPGLALVFGNVAAAGGVRAAASRSATPTSCSTRCC